MVGLGTWAAVATIVAAAIAGVTLGGSFLFRAGRLWERVRRLVDVAEKNQEDIGDLQVEVKRLWIASAEGVELPDDLLPEADEEDEPMQQELISGDEEEDDDAH